MFIVGIVWWVHSGGIFAMATDIALQKCTLNNDFTLYVYHGYHAGTLTRYWVGTWYTDNLQCIPHHSHCEVN